MDNNLELVNILTAINNGENIILHSPGGTGKCLAPLTPVLMFDGCVKKAKHIIVGDKLMGDDSTPRNVLSTCSGVDEMFLIETPEGDSFIVNLPHILSLKNSESEIIDISLEEYIKKPDEWKGIYKCFKTIVDFPEDNSDLPLYPYFLGLWLGSENSSFSTITINNNKTLEWLKLYTSSIKHHLIKIGNNHYSFTGGNEDICIKKELYCLKLKNKHIPKKYLCGSRYTRIEVLAGILDTNFNENEGVFELDLKNKKLSDDIIFLSRSLGIASYYFCGKIKIYGKGLEKIPFITKKMLSFKNTQTYLTHEMKITPLGKGNYCGFTLDGNGRFLLENFIVTHNTYILCELAKYISEKHKMVCCTATTGVAAINLNVSEKKISGTTLHRWAGVGLAQDEAKKLHSKIYNDKRSSKRWLHTDVLIIDEISMLGADFMDKLDYIGREIRHEKEKPFGGIQLILSGDFLQLPPVKEEWCFKSKVWEKLNLIPFIFNKPKRYEDINYFELLLRIREGKQTPEDIKKLKARTRSYDKLLKALEEAKGKSVIKPTILHSKRVDVDFYNTQELDKLPGECFEFIADDTFSAYTKGARKEIYMNKLEDAAPKLISLKVGAQVMLKYNLDVKGGLVNGSRGVVIEGGHDFVYVRFVNSVKLIVEKHTWEVEDNEGKGTRSQIPFILAWSITIHKSQGCTLDYAVCDLTNVFASGQTYVALSRVRSLRGLFISGFYPDCIKVNKTALKYSKELKKKAEEYVPELNEKSEEEDFDFLIFDEE